MHPLLLLLLASFLLRPPAASMAQSSSCWPKACGGLNITYPFWVGEPAGRPPCGPPSFQLRCNSSRAFMSESVYQAYQVVAISAENRSFHVVDHNLPIATACPAPPFNISMFARRPFVFSRANREILFLSKCTVSPPAASAGFHRMPCDNTSFARLGDGRNFSSHGVQGGIPPGCLFTVLPTLGPPDGNGDDYVASMKNGFLLEWTEVPGDCTKCMASGGECVYGDTGLEFACSCSGHLRPDKCDINGIGSGRKTALIVNIQLTI